MPLYRHHFDIPPRLPAVEAVLEREKPDFVQIDYSLDDREAEKSILPVAADVKAGVLTALPFGTAAYSARCTARNSPTGRGCSRTPGGSFS